ncbi:hypothetical protein ABK040_000368 [Willaertia magna]
MQISSLRDSRFYQPFFKYPQINKSFAAVFDLQSNQLTFIDKLTTILMNNEIKDLNYLNQIVTLTFGYDQLVLIYENYNNGKLMGVIINYSENQNPTCLQFNLPEEFKKKEDIQFFYYSSDFGKEVYFLQLKSTKQVFVKGENNESILGIFNEDKDNTYFEDWQIITDKRLQNIKDVKTNTYTTLFFMEDKKIYACGRDTNGELYKLKIDPEIQIDKLTNEEIENLQIIKADLLIEGTIILTKGGEIYSTSTTDFYKIHSTFIKENKSKRLEFIGAKKNKLTQFAIDFKVIDMFVIDNGLLVVRKDDLKLFILMVNDIIDIGLYVYEVKNVFFSYTEFYFETKKNELVFLKDKKKIVFNCNNSFEYSKLNFPTIRSILNFNKSVYVFFEEEDLIKRNFYFPLNECGAYKDISMNKFY